MLRLSVKPVRKEAQPGWQGLENGWLGLRLGWLGLGPGWLGLRPGWLGLQPGWMAQRGGRTDRRTDGRTDGRKIAPFYRTLSPIGAAALPATMKTKHGILEAAEGRVGGSTKMIVT